ncbi:hypothetical protein BCR33DRAFT_810160 [Rhizoclosmatium globosum]|uniref:Uncharacterized protein n=1 Tax=Rhizoclosmatium globosum TaxID=329046 RepID=A0A1Y2CHE6_9FUNG|nr:hypothetical protein BCR33DRAFT_810160 [Rhizoclosmatium globosum]|eukprot:ORY46432.1 hypothetical protein BCR33DRAFT_810160 [Rhizoclosmatium globosum]
MSFYRREGILSLEDVEDEATDYCESEQETLLSHDIDDDLATDYGDEDTESESELFSASLNAQSLVRPICLLANCVRVYLRARSVRTASVCSHGKETLQMQDVLETVSVRDIMVKHEKRGCKKSNAPQHSIRQTKPKDITRVFQPVVPKETEIQTSGILFHPPTSGF